MRKVCLVVGLLLCATGATAQTTRTPARFDAVESKARTGSDAEPVICRTAPELGSLVRRIRRCMTGAQWRMRTRMENDDARELVRLNTGLVH